MREKTELTPAEALLFNEVPRKPILPPVDFGAKLFAGLGKDVL